MSLLYCFSYILNSNVITTEHFSRQCIYCVQLIQQFPKKIQVIQVKINFRRKNILLTKKSKSIIHFSTPIFQSRKDLFVSGSFLWIFERKNYSKKNILRRWPTRNVENWWIRQLNWIKCLRRIFFSSNV